MILRCRDFALPLHRKTHVMGILNVTPDSFSDGGLFYGLDKAVERALQMAQDGADIIDVGGESTRPGAESVSFQEEVRRTIPVIERIAPLLKIPVCIDTYKAAVARMALDAGASVINDISGLTFDPAMAGLAAEYDVPVVLMHIRGKPKSMQMNPVYESLIEDLLRELEDRISRAREAGVREDNILIDPGIGFGKTFDHNLQIIKNLSRFRSPKKPIVIGVSRKAFIGSILDGAPPEQRLEGTAAAVAVSIINGASIVRVHDVREMVKVARVADAIVRGAVSASQP